MDTNVTPEYVDEVNPQEQRLLKQAEEMIGDLDVDSLANMLGYVESLEDQLRMNTGEPACTTSTFMRGPSGAEILMVIKSPSEVKAWEKLTAFVKGRVDQGYRPVIKYPDRSETPTQGQSKSQAPAPGQSPTQAPAPGQAPAPAQTSNDGDQQDQEQQIHIVKMDVTPRPDGRADLLLFMENHKWPDLKVNNWPVPKLVELLSPTGAWTEDHLSASRSYTVNFIAKWKPSDKVSASGKPYKNVTALLPNQ